MASKPGRAQTTSRQDPDAIQIDIYRRMTPAQRWAAACQLHETARQLKRAAIKQAHPEFDHRQVESRVREIFLYAST